MTKLDLTLPVPLYRGISCDVSYPETVGKMIEGNAFYTTCRGVGELSITPYDIFAPASVDILPETLGMYIFKEDMNGKSIFTRDVLKYESIEDGETITEYMLVYWDREVCGILLHTNHSDLPVDADEFISELEVIGNIDENPELLKLFPQLQEVTE